MGPGVAGAGGTARARVLALALLTALGLFAAPPARAAVRLRPCPKSGEPLECGTVRVPLDPAGAIPGTGGRAARRAPARRGAVARRRARARRRPRPVGLVRARLVRTDRARRSPARDPRPARHGTLGRAALPGARALARPGRDALRRRDLRRAPRARARPLHHPRVGRGHRSRAPRAGDRPPGARRRLLRHQGRAGLRVRSSRPRRAAAARLRGAGRRGRPVPDRLHDRRRTRAARRLHRALPGVHP